MRKAPKRARDRNQARADHGAAAVCFRLSKSCLKAVWPLAIPLFLWENFVRFHKKEQRRIGALSPQIYSLCRRQ